MKDYISREAAINNFMQYTWYDEDGYEIHDSDEKRKSLEDMFSSIPAAFEDAQIGAIPAADVRPVVRAAWQSWEQDRPPCKWYSCDYCGYHSLAETPFCPNCGADMRGEDDGS